MTTLQYIAMTMMPLIITLLLHLVKKRGVKSETGLSVVAGLLFGLSACYGTQFGVDIGMAILNTRDASVICAGLFFGWPAAIISSIIGSVFRFLSPLWGVGEYTRMACSLATLSAGFFTAILVKFLFKERPKWYQGFMMGAFTEVFHMLMVFVTHPNDLHTAYAVIQHATVSMIMMNAVSVCLAVIAVDISDRAKLQFPDKNRIAIQFNYGLSIAMMIGFVLSVAFTAKLEKTISIRDTESLLKSNVEDVKEEVRKENNYALATQFKRVGANGYVLVADQRLFIISNLENLKGFTLMDIGLSEQKPSANEMHTGIIMGEESFFLYDEINGYHIIAVLSTYEARFSERVTLTLTIFMELLVFAMLYLMIILLVNRLVIFNIETVNRDLQKITSGDLNTRLGIETNTEFQSLSGGINTTVDKLKQLISEANARIDKELEFARQIQLENLPSGNHPYPERKEFDLYAQMFTAKEVGGDFYDYFFNRDNKLFFLIADVSGKGIPAAMVMMKAKTLLRSLAEENLTVSQLAETANNSLCENNEAGLFVTAWVGCLDLKTGRLNYVNAGHNAPLLIGKNNEISWLDCRSGLVLAGLPSIKYKEFSLNLEEGDRILLYTDGVTEATDAAGNLFSEQRLKKVASEQNTGCEALCKAIKTKVDEFVKQEEQFDDITMLALEYKGSKED